MLSRRGLFNIAISIIIGITLSAPAQSQEGATPPGASSPQQSEHAARKGLSTGEPDDTLFFAYLDDHPDEAAGPLYELLKDKPFFKDVLIPRANADRKFRPLLQMRYWWDKPQRFLPSVAFCFFIAWLFWLLIPGKLSLARQKIASHFWKSFFTGIFCAAVWLLFTRTMFLTHVGWPLGIVSTACFQAALLVGLSVIISITGHALAVLLQVRRWPIISSHSNAVRIIELFAGSAFCALVLILPSVTVLPNSGMRLLFLFSLLGMGGICRALREPLKEPAI